jgi:hypothetical protein
MTTIVCPTRERDRGYAGQLPTSQASVLACDFFHAGCAVTLRRVYVSVPFRFASAFRRLATVPFRLASAFRRLASAPFRAGAPELRLSNAQPNVFRSHLPGLDAMPP